MDWELYERFRASVLLAAIAFLSLMLLIFQRAPAVRYVRVCLVRTTLPLDRFLSDLRSPEPSTESSPEASANASASSPSWAETPELSRRLNRLVDENRRLQDLLQLKDARWPNAVAAHVTGRDPLRWFQEIVLDKGKEDGIDVDDPVVAVVGTKEGLVGRIIEVGAHVSRVMLIQDSLSAVASTVHTDREEDGVVEGNNGHELTLKFLDRSSHIKLGDTVITSGLGETFPNGIPIGTVLDLGLDTRQLFLEARVKPVVATNEFHMVLVLTTKRAAASNEDS
jgi:rod shape-determining protein MreC